jgi:hypothetical protein
LELAARARELVDEGMNLAAACRVARAEDQLDAARKRITQLEDAAAQTVAQFSAGEDAEARVR